MSISKTCNFINLLEIKIIITTTIMYYEIERKVQKIRNEFHCGTTLPLSFRLQQLQGLSNLLKEKHEEIISALIRDLRKPRTETILYEIGVVENELASMMKNLKKYTAPEILPVNILTLTDTGYIYKEPLGVVLIIGSWNFPFQLCLAPLVGCIAAGNCAIIKPSENASISAQTISRLLPQYISQDCYQVVLGGVEETQELLQNRFDHIFFTGSPNIGRKIMVAANTQWLTTVTLELGGKNPCYIDDSADIEMATKRIIWGKFFNCGQACISVDYILCSKIVRDKFLRFAYQFIHEWYGNSRNGPVLSRIVNQKHFQRLSKLLSFIETNKKGVIAIGGHTDENTLEIEPTVVIDVQVGDPIMEEEIFGPILPVICVKDIDEAIATVHHKSHLATPLALYTFAKDESKNDKFIGSIQSGGVCRNDTILHTSWKLLPFGGVGGSGIGSYHGKKTFDTFSHRRSCLHRGMSYFSEKVYELRYPPYTTEKTKLLSFALRHFDRFFIARQKLYKFCLIFLAVIFCMRFRNFLKSLLIKKLSLLRISS